MELGLTDRTCIVTGASRGIGAATAALLESEGARVVRVSRSEGIDVTAPDAGERVLAVCDGAPWALVNNAGVSQARGMDIADEDWQEQWSCT